MTGNPKTPSFLKASGWLMTATTLGGAFMFLVQVVAVGWLNDDQYGLMNALFQTLNLAMIPALGLQTVFAQQSASDSTPLQKSLTSLTAKNVLSAITSIWILAAFTLLITQNLLASQLKSPSTWPLWLTLTAALPQLWLPVWMGILQGQQKFFWLGNATIANGFGRFCAACILVGVCGFGVSGAVGAALIGFCGALGLCWWRVEKSASGGGEGFSWGEWLKRIMPLTLGLGSSTFFLGYDMIVVRAKFEPDMTGQYGAAGLCGRGLVIFTIPIAQVMFPKVVQMMGSGFSAGRVVRASMLATIGMAGVACGVVTVGGWIGIHLMDGSWESPLFSEAIGSMHSDQKARISGICRLAPWFVWCMTPLCLANVLINQLMAMREFRHFGLLVSIAAVYAVYLAIWTPSTLVGVIQTIGFFSFILLLCSGLAIRLRRGGKAEGMKINGIPED